MTYLIIKILLLLLIATILGFLLGRWWVRRQFVDVSDSFQSLQRAVEATENAPWGDVFARFDGLEPLMRNSVKQELDAQPAIDIPSVDLSGIEGQLRAVEAKIADIPEPEPLDVDPVLERIAALETAVRGIPQPAQPEPVDLAPVNERLISMAALVKAIPQQLPQTQEINLQAIEDKMTGLTLAVQALEQADAPEVPDLSGLESRLNSLQQALGELTASCAGSPDLAPLSGRIDALQSGLAAIPRVNLEPVESRLGDIEERLAQLLSQPVTETPAAASVNSLLSAPDELEQPKKEPRLLASASYGQKDDLKRISGVGPMLEDLLNTHGVFYFWQVADWDASDIEVMDDRLEVFKGRIERDNWVVQARELSLLPETAKKPEGD